MSDNKSYPPVMKGVFIEKQGGPLIIRDVRTPEPGPGEVLVKIMAAPVNPSDLAAIRKASAVNDITTFIPGLEASGVVVAAGKGLLPHLWMGKRVACSSEYPTSGTWAEYMVTHAGKCFPLSSKVSDEQGSMSLVNPMTALSFFEIAREQNHKAIIINAAASALGRIVELLGEKNGIAVINIVRNQKQLENLKSLGAAYVLDSSDPLFIENLGILSHRLRATVLFDTVCSRQLGQMIDVLPQNSSVIIYGNLSREELIMINPRRLIDNNIKISGFFLGRRAKENGIFKNILNLRKVNSLMISGLTIKIRDRFPLSRAQEAVDTYLTNMSEGKVILIPG